MVNIPSLLQKLNGLILKKKIQICYNENKNYYLRSIIISFTSSEDSDQDTSDKYNRTLFQ